MEKAKNLNFYELKALREKTRQAHEDKYAEDSRRRLIKIATTKVRTAFIGAIAAFEEEFGFLWGHDKHPHDLTADEARMRDAYENARTKALNVGNNQLRALENEINEHTVKWVRKKYNIPIVREDEDGSRT